MRIHASAPGKLVLSGEYAVLEGAPALVLAVDARARVVVEDSDRDFHVAAPDVGVPDARFVFEQGRVQWLDLDVAQHEVLSLATRVIQNFGEDQPPFRISLDTRDFSLRGEKFGLGSSAALAVALAGALCERAQREAPRVEELIALHRAWQNDRGSGVDVASSCCGSLSIYRLRDGAPDIERTRWPRGLRRRCIWTGKAASTSAKLRKLSEWRAREPVTYSAAMRHLRQAAETVADAFRTDDAQAVLHGIYVYAQCLHEFDAAAGLDIFAGGHREIAARAREYGVVYKPCGAGGGDIGVALCADADRMQAFLRDIARSPFREIELTAAERGLYIRRDGQTSGNNAYENANLTAARVRSVFC